MEHTEMELPTIAPEIRHTIYTLLTAAFDLAPADRKDLYQAILHARYMLEGISDVCHCDVCAKLRDLEAKATPTAEPMCKLCHEELAQPSGFCGVCAGGEE